MSKKAAADNDSDDLESLFDSIVSEKKETPIVAVKVAAKAAPKADDADLESLFDSIVAGNNESTKAAPVAAKESSSGVTEGKDVVFNEIGHLTRALHDSLRDLGFDKDLQKAASAIPDARDRLNYIATMTKAAAERVLNATESAQPIVEKIESGAKSLAADWQKMFDNKMDVEQFKQLALQTHAYLLEVPKQTKQTNASLTEIMMAQDFQDLTGQVIKKVMDVTQSLEKQLLELLINHAPADVKMDSSLLNGPVVNAAGRTDVVTNQKQVDDLLESLGF
jgi:chemotaxis protein CheZ